MNAKEMCMNEPKRRVTGKMESFLPSFISFLSDFRCLFISF